MTRHRANLCAQLGDGTARASRGQRKETGGCDFQFLGRCRCITILYGVWEKNVNRRFFTAGVCGLGFGFWVLVSSMTRGTTAQ